MANPIPSGTVGRTDQGVDISASPGAAIVDPVPGLSRMVGTLANWYQGQPLGWFKVVTGPFRGRYWYGAEQISYSTRPGQTVRGGQRIGSYARQGTGTEFGWATSTGETQAMATTGYTEGQPTQAGSDFLSQIIRGRNRVGPAGAGGPSQAQTLQQLWINNGGPASQARTAAAVAMAESSGNTQAVNHDSNGSTDYGLWQINSTHGYNSARLLSDPNYNARAAVAVWRSSGWGAWSTYNSGAYLAFLGVRSPTIRAGITRPGGSQDTGSSAVDAQFASYEGLYAGRSNPASTTTDVGLGLPSPPNPLLEGTPFGPAIQFFGGLLGHLGDPFKGPANAISQATDFLKWVAWIFDPVNILRAIEFLTGLSLMLVGLSTVMKHTTGEGPVQMVGDSPVGKAARGVADRTPAGRIVRERRAYSEGRRHHREDERNKARQAAYRKGRSGVARNAGKPKRTSRRQRRREAEDIPF